MIRKHKLLLSVALMAGIVFVVVMVKLKQPPQRTQEQASATAVRILDVQPQMLMTQAKGYGQVLPARSWKAVANVAGRVVWKHPELESGNFIASGTRLLQIDPSRYELAKAASEADLAGVAAELHQLEQEQENTQALLALEQRRLALAERELERAQVLAQRGALSATRLDEQQRAALLQEQAVQDLKNQLSLIPVRRDALTARKGRAEASLASAIKDLEDTGFEAPWALRVHQADIETGQYVSPGQTLFIVDDIAAAEATVQVELAQLRRVLSQLPAADAARQQPVNIHQHLPLEQLEVRVSPSSVPDIHWRGRLTRVTGSLDASTRTLQAVITVEEPYRSAEPPARPPLVRNMFVQATISALTREPVVVIPASALHQHEVYLADNHNRLQRKPVTIAWQQGELAVIAEGLNAGDRLILDDLVPAVEGSLLAPQPDEQARHRLQQLAQGEQP
ncbi:efflux RND transporter periplasmic adaptor subunit [Oceanimonas smirnovii]|uniref:efflux RND transporter periplasmic adaptor subunit n=1 Tax=Oceanimonas smirnovii TaxID=264574 RepID=UPI003AAD41EB